MFWKIALTCINFENFSLLEREADVHEMMGIDEERNVLEQSLLSMDNSIISSIKMDAATQTKKNYGCCSVGVQCNIAGLAELTLLPPENMSHPDDSTKQSAEDIESSNPSSAFAEHNDEPVMAEDDLIVEDDDESVYEDDDDSSWSSFESDDDYSGSSTLGINKNL